MKRILYFAALISMAISVACSSKNSSSEGTTILTVSPNSISVSAEGGTKNITIDANCTWAVSVGADWISVSTKSGQAGTTSNTVTISASTVTAERSSFISVRNNDSMLERRVTVTQAAYVKPNDGNDEEEEDDTTISVTEALSVQKGTTVSIEESTVVAVSQRSYLLTDGTSYILAYKGSETGLEVGDRVTVEATIDIFNNVPQLKNPAATKVGHADYTHPTPQTMDAEAIERFLDEQRIGYVKMQGELEKSGNFWNVAVNGASAMGSLTYPTSDMCPDSLAGEMVEILGYTLYVSNSNGTKYVCIIATGISVIEGGGDTPSNAVFYRDWAELPLCDDRGDNFQYVSHGDISVGGKSGQRNFTLCFDRKSKGAIWVAYPLHYCHRGSGNRTDDWQYDPKIPTQYQPSLYSSYGSYTRGHQLPSSSRNKTKDINRATFYFSNMTPQTSTFNSGVWQRLESSVQDNVCSDTLYVVSGAIFDGQHDSSVDVTTTDKSGNVCAVPSHYYKALLRTKNGETGKAIRSINKAEDLQAIAILMKHVDYSTSLQSSDIISIEELEEITGVTFFPAINDAIEEEVKKQKNRSDWEGL